MLLCHRAPSCYGYVAVVLSVPTDGELLLNFQNVLEYVSTGEKIDLLAQDCFKCNLGGWGEELCSSQKDPLKFTEASALLYLNGRQREDVLSSATCP